MPSASEATPPIDSPTSSSATRPTSVCSKETRARSTTNASPGWLERMAAARLAEYEEIVGYHLERAYRYREELGPPDEHARALAARAATRLGAAGGRAYEREDIAGAITLLDRALSLPSTDASDRAELMVDLGMALIDAGELVTSRPRCSPSAAEGAAASGERNLELRALLERAFGRYLTDPEASEAERGCGHKGRDASVRGIRQRAGPGAGTPAEVRTEDVEATRYRDAEAKLRPALAYATKAGARRQRKEIVLWIMTALYFGPTPTGDAVRRLEALGEEVGPAPGLYAMRGEFKRARSIYRRAAAGV